MFLLFFLEVFIDIEEYMTIKEIAQILRSHKQK